MASTERGSSTVEAQREDLACCERMAVIFRALGNATRLGILRRVLQEEVCVGELQDQLGCSQPNISQHLAVLRDRGLVAPHRDGNRVCYTLADPRIGDLLLVAEDMLDAGGQ